MTTSLSGLLSSFSELSFLSDSPKSPYRYRPLKGDQIRLLRLLPPTRQKGYLHTEFIECELVHVSLEDPGQYEALSYVWGPPERTKTIQIRIRKPQLRAKVLGVTDSLSTALRSLRYASKTRILWIDQLCNNQDDKKEMNAQVKRMGDIYRQSSCTVIWLGIPGPDAELLQDMYRRLATLPSNTKGSGGLLMLDHQVLAKVIGTSYKAEKRDLLIQRRRQLLETFLSLPWFCRAWVYQEAVVAPRVEMVWGSIVLPLDFVTGLVVSVYGIAKSAEHGRWHKRIKKTRGFAPLRTIYHDRTAYKKATGELKLLNVMWHARKHLDATVPHDRVYAFLSVIKKSGTSSRPNHEEATCAIQDLITPNYEDTVEDVYTDLALAAIRSSCTLDILQYVVPTKQSPQPSKLPSWVPNWADKTFTCGSPLFVPGVPNPLSACRDAYRERHYAPTLKPNRIELPALGHTLGRVSSVLRHKFKHTYFSPTLNEAYQLEKLETLLDTEIVRLSHGKHAPDWFENSRREVLLRTILADGSFTTTHDICHPIKDLLAAYDTEDSNHIAEDPEGEKLRHYLRQTGEMASGKKAFLTKELDIGLGYSTVREGDIVCILYGSKMPCVLRNDERERHRYRFVGLCFLHDWMDGKRNPRSWEWGKQIPERFVLI